jgi:hypothetical protein
MPLAVMLMATASTGDGTQGDMLSQQKRHEIQVLLKAGFSPSDVASGSGASEDTVRRIGAETEVRHTDDAMARKERRVGRPAVDASERSPRPFSACGSTRRPTTQHGIGHLAPRLHEAALGAESTRSRVSLPDR